jgi:hypothetical protein
MDNFTFTPGTGETGAAKNIGGVLYPQVIPTEIDGSDTGVAAKLGPVTETAPITDTASSGINGRLQRISQRLSSLIALLPTALGSGGGLKVDGSGTALPVSASSLPLPTGAAQETGGHLAGIDNVQGTQADTAWTSGSGSVIALLKAIVGKLAGTITTSISGSVGVTGTFFQTTQPVSATSLPLPTGAATAAKQPALGTAGTPSTDVISVQGATSMTALKVDGSGVTQPVSGTVTVNAGTNLNTSALALETGGNLASIKADTDNLALAQGSTTSGQKGNLGLGAVTTAAPTYTTAQSAPLSLDTTGALRVNVTAGGAGGGAVTNAGTFAVQNTAATPAGTNTIGSVKLTDGTSTAVLKAASTAAAATDPAIVVAISPNNTVPVSIASLPSGAVTNAGTFAVQAAQSGTWTVQIGNTPNTTAILTTNVPTTTGGPTVQRIKAAASTNATSVKASAGQVYGWALYNNTASARFVKIYNKASSPTVGTDTPAFTIIIPASGGTNVEWSNGIPLGTGIALAITGLIADSDTTAVAADDVHGVLLYK